MNFGLFDKITKNEVYIIAEMSANHGGSLDHALEIVRQAKKAGADSLTIDCDREEFRIKGGLWDGYRLYDLYRNAATPYEWHRVIMEECEKVNIDFLSTPFDKDAVDFLEELNVGAYKIASFELVDLPLIAYAASKGKPMILSTGMASPEEIREAVDACKRVGNEQTVLLKCCSEYPAPWPDMHLGNIPDMRKRFGVPVGLSDHSAGSLGAVVGAALGACVIEKHVMLAGTESADSGFSMDMDDFAAMVRDVRNAKIIANGPDYTLTEGEKKQKIFRRSLYATADIRAGEILTEENIRSIRPDCGLAPKLLPDVVGKRAARDIPFGTPLRAELVDNNPRT